MQIKEWLEQAERRLQEAGIASARLDSQLLLAHALDKDRAYLAAHPEERLTEIARKNADRLLRQRARRLSVARLTGQRQFFGLDFMVNEHVLIPRVETELIAEIATELAPQNGRLLDMGTGSGALAVAIKHGRADLTVTATDVSAEALAVARTNAKRHKTNINFIQSDLWQAINSKQTFDLVVTNLPYLSSEAMRQLMPEANLEPKIALFGGEDGLDIYRRFLKELPDRLSPGGLLMTECDPWQQEALAEEAKAAGLRPLQQHYFIMVFEKI